MSNSPGFRAGAIGSAVPKSFSSSPNSDAPFQRTCQTAYVDSFLPSNSIDLSLSRKVANPLDAIFGSVITHPTAVTTRGRSPSFSASCWPAVFVVANLCSRKNPNADDEICCCQFRPAERNENADNENYGYYGQFVRSQGNELGHDDSDRSHQRQTNKWLTRRAEQLHLLAVFAYPVFATQAAICLRATHDDCA